MVCAIFRKFLSAKKRRAKECFIFMSPIFSDLHSIKQILLREVSTICVITTVDAVHLTTTAEAAATAASPTAAIAASHQTAASPTAVEITAETMAADLAEQVLETADSG